MNNLAGLYGEQDRLEEAEALYLAVLDGKERAFGEGHGNTANTLFNLASLYRATDRYPESKSFFERALRIDEEVFGPDHAYVAEDLVDYAELLRVMGDDKGAAALEARARLIRGE